MPLPDDKTTINFVIDKSIKHKLQVLADSEHLKLSPYVALKLQEVVEAFEQQILENFGSEEFLKTYHTIFGAGYPPLIPYDVAEEFDEEEARRNLIASINAASGLKTGVDNRNIRNVVVTTNYDNLKVSQPISRIQRDVPTELIRRKTRRDTPPSNN